MITIKKADFDKLRAEHPDYIGRALIDHTHAGKTCKKGDFTAFEYLLTGGTPETKLIFEHIHFEIV